MIRPGAFTFISRLIANGGGSIIATSSTAGIKGLPLLREDYSARNFVRGAIGLTLVAGQLLSLDPERQRPSLETASTTRTWCTTR